MTVSQPSAESEPEPFLVDIHEPQEPQLLPKSVGQPLSPVPRIR